MGERGSFGVTVVAGLLGGVAAAVAGNQVWVDVTDADAGRSGDAAFASTLVLRLDGAPAVTALALVVLAVWGVVLVTRGWFRRAVAWLGLLAAVATLVVAASSWFTQPGDVETRLGNLEVAASRTAWSYVGVLGGLVTTLAAVAAVRGVGRWPEMGRRYDAPTAGGPPIASPHAVADDGEVDHLGLWKALDEGRDPTDPPHH